MTKTEDLSRFKNTGDGLNALWAHLHKKSCELWEQSELEKQNKIKMTPYEKYPSATNLMANDLASEIQRSIPFKCISDRYIVSVKVQRVGGGETCEVTLYPTKTVPPTIESRVSQLEKYVFGK